MFQIRKIEVKRGGNPFPGVMNNGDRLDSIAEFYDSMGLVFRATNVNTDPTLSWAGKGGIVAESSKQKNQMYFICGPRDNGAIVLHIFQATPGRYEKIETVADLTDADRLLVSLIPNPQHGGRKEIDYVLFHNIGTNGDGSQGCFSAEGFPAIIKHFSVGDKGFFNLTRADGWTAPKEYTLPNGETV